jgi:hypothetical protein
VANPNLLSNSTSTLDVLVEAQLASGNTDYTVPSGTAWAIRSLSVCNVSGGAVTLNISVIKSGGTARKVLHNTSISAGDTLVVGRDLVASLPEGAVLRLNAGTGAALDALVTGVVTA